MHGPTVGPAPATNGNVVRVNLGRMGAFIGVILFLLQIATIIVTSVRSSAGTKAEVGVLTATVGRLVEANQEMAKSVTTLNQNVALLLQRIEVLEKANPPSGRRP